MVYITLNTLEVCAYHCRWLQRHQGNLCPALRLASDWSQESMPAGVPGRAHWWGGALGAAAGGRVLERQQRQPAAGRAALGWRAEPAAARAPAAGAGRAGGPVSIMPMLCSTDLACLLCQGQSRLKSVVGAQHLFVSKCGCCAGRRGKGPAGAASHAHAAAAALPAGPARGAPGHNCVPCLCQPDCALPQA